MRYSPFHSNLDEFRKAKDAYMVKDILLSEISDAIVNRREEVIDKLNHSGLYVNSSVGTDELTKIVNDNLGNKDFIKGMALVVGSKSPKDFELFSAMNGGKTTEREYYNDVYSSMNGNIESEDGSVLSEKVFAMSGAGNNSGRNSGGLFPTLFVLGGSAAAIYFIAFRPIKK